ncbi:MAG TPA: AAA family ATPase, partial [Chloroflexota bacterium]|nr:AAA family ATPase [Chloroflexota bacterium]
RWLAERHRLSLAPEQEAATRMALTAPVSLLTGGPGTGKTHTLKAVLSLARAKGLRCLLAAPTGRAAKRMSEATGLPAATLHRLLELRPGGRAGRNAGNPLPAELVVVDETSMLDALLANQLLKAIAPGCHLLLVGDPDQLPSVGAGDVLADLLRAGQFPVTRLSHIFRQGAGSGIAANAQLINAGEMPRFGGPTRDCYFIPAETAAEAASVVVDLVARRLPARYGLQRGDAQVLSPMHRGEAGVGALNALLQERLNPSRPEVAELRSAGRVYRPGDRVLQLKNDYDLDVFNGDLGTVHSVDAVEQELVLLLDDGRRVRYPGANLFALTHAYAISVHKCIAGHERVWTARRGLEPIKDIRAGEAIHTGQHALRPVVATMPTGRRRVVRLTTRMGYQIDVSEEHPLLVADAALPRFVPAAQLTPAHYVCLSRQTLDTDGPVSLPVTETPATGRSLHLPAQLNEALAWLLGVIVGGGSYRNTRDGTLEITNHHPEVLSECRRILASYGLRVGAYKTPGRRATRLYVTSQTFRRWLSKLGLRSVEANDKTAPALIFHAPVRCRAAFLRGLFDTRGRVSVGATRSCRLVTASSQLATEVQHLLLSLGMISHVSRVTARAFRVGLSGTSIECFKRVVGFSVGYKRDRLRAMLDRPLRPRAADVDRIPFSRLLMRQVAQTLVHFWGKTRGSKGKWMYAAAGAGTRRRNTSGVAELYAGVTHGNLKLSYLNVRQIR